MATFTEVLMRADVHPDPDIADLVVPVLGGVQRQGDVLILPIPADSRDAQYRGALVPREGVSVVAGEATGNAHLLHADGLVSWRPVDERGSMVLGVLHVAEGARAWVIHTAEHGANGVSPGVYELRGKREMAHEIRRVVD